jgi:hypothetical protein
MGCGGSKSQMSEAAQKFTNVITAKPDLTKFAYRSDNIKTLGKAIASPVFGGSVLLPVGKKGQPRLKKNPLEAEISKLNTEVIFNGGFYFLPNIREDETSQQYMDIYLLTQSIKDQDLARLIKLIHDENEQSEANAKSTKPKKIKEVKDPIRTRVATKPVFWKEIKEAVTGYVRIVRYTNHSVTNMLDQNGEVTHKEINMAPQSLEITMVEEGGYRNGMKDGYCRVLYADDGKCEVGFFQKNIPMGKYCMYKLDGSYILPEGLYEGQNSCKTKIEIANYMQKIAQQKPTSLGPSTNGTRDIER